MSLGHMHAHRVRQFLNNLVAGGVVYLPILSRFTTYSVPNLAAPNQLVRIRPGHRPRSTPVLVPEIQIAVVEKKRRREIVQHVQRLAARRQPADKLLPQSPPTDALGLKGPFPVTA